MASIHDTKCQIIKNLGADALGQGILKTKLNKNVVPYVTHQTSVFDKGQLSFVRKLLNFLCKCVLPIITHWYSLDDAIIIHQTTSQSLFWQESSNIKAKNNFFSTLAFYFAFFYGITSTAFAIYVTIRARFNDGRILLCWKNLKYITLWDSRIIWSLISIALYFPNRTSSRESISFVEQGIAEARRKNHIKGPIEVWFSDKKKKTYN